ncbi:phytanoyl-CoA dioxygenase family protein [Sphingobium sp. WCS2017Hpa-17]|uniref:phytanoyl-CoA dioxygenase family protein n=1 Tax=Sphingobium sp. WCS2017Hpa-17 TaxID=3073638 RepID=UPI0028893437|nr:phytanoyl-CoA dioxygenase family protein [Sphingobium sp. WCS2017Hpa-17]
MSASSSVVEDGSSLPMFALSDALAPAIASFGLEANVREMKEQGYTVLRNVAEPAFLDRLRSKLLEVTLEAKGQYFGIERRGASSDMLLEQDDVFAEAAINPKVMAMIEFMCGQRPLMSQLSGSVRFEGANAMGLHVDQDWMPAPMPEHNALTTACWYLDDISEAGAGATKVIPGTHNLRRHPTAAEADAQEGAVPILCKKGDVAMWDGRLWHANYARTLPGERVLLHATYCRLAYRPLEDYGPIAQRLIERHGPVMEDLLGRNLWYGNRAFNAGGVDMTKYKATRDAARS